MLAPETRAFVHKACARRTFRGSAAGPRHGLAFSHRSARSICAAGQRPRRRRTARKPATHRASRLCSMICCASAPRPSASSTASSGRERRPRRSLSGNFATRRRPRRHRPLGIERSQRCPSAAGLRAPRRRSFAGPSFRFADDAQRVFLGRALGSLLEMRIAPIVGAKLVRCTGRENQREPAMLAELDGL